MATIEEIEEAYEVAKEGLLKLDPKKNVTDFEKEFNQIFSEFQTSTGIAEEKHIRLPDFLFLAYESQEDIVKEYYFPVEHKPIPANISFAKLLEISQEYLDEYGHYIMKPPTPFQAIENIEIGGKIIKLRSFYQGNQFIDKNDNMVIIPYFINNLPSDATNFASQILIKAANLALCPDGTAPEVSSNARDKVAEQISKYFKPLLTNATDNYKTEQLEYGDMATILDLLSKLHETGISTYQLAKQQTNITEAGVECPDLNSLNSLKSGFIGFRRSEDFISAKYPEACAVFSRFRDPSDPYSSQGGTINYVDNDGFYIDSSGYIVLNECKLPKITIHEFLHNILDGHFNDIKNKQLFGELLNLGDRIPITVMTNSSNSKQINFIYRESKEVLGLLDIGLITADKWLSIHNKGKEKYELISQCLKPLEKLNQAINITNIVDQLECPAEETVAIPPSYYSQSPLTTPTVNLNNQNHQEQKSKYFMDSIEDPFLRDFVGKLIPEAAAISTRTITEVILKLCKTDPKYSEAVASTIETASRLTAIGLFHGAHSAGYSAITTGAVTAFKVADVATKISEKAQNQLKTFTQSLIGEEGAERVSEVISEQYKKVPAPIKAFAPQIMFISLMYAISESFKSQSSIENEKQKEEMSYSARVGAGIVTSVASGIMRFAARFVVDCCFPSHNHREREGNNQMPTQTFDPNQSNHVANPEQRRNSSGENSETSDRVLQPNSDTEINDGIVSQSSQASEPRSANLESPQDDRDDRNAGQTTRAQDNQNIADSRPALENSEHLTNDPEKTTREAKERSRSESESSVEDDKQQGIEFSIRKAPEKFQTKPLETEITSANQPGFGSPVASKGRHEEGSDFSSIELEENDSNKSSNLSSPAISPRNSSENKDIKNSAASPISPVSSKKSTTSARRLSSGSNKTEKSGSGKSYQV